MNNAGNIYKLIPKIMGEVGFIGKDRKNLQQGYAYRGIDDLFYAFQGPLSKNGVFIVTEVLEHSREDKPTKSGGVLTYTILKVKFSFCAEDGSFVTITTMGEAMDSADKSTNKAMSAALKYALLMTFCIPTDNPDDDADHHTPEPAAKPKYAPTKAAALPAAKAKEALPVVKAKPEPKKEIWNTLTNEFKMSENDAIEWLRGVSGKENSKLWTDEDIAKIYKAIAAWKP